MMNCDRARQHMMDRLYEPAGLTDLEALEKHLQLCPSCAREWADVLRAQTFLGRRRRMDPPQAVQAAVLQHKSDPVRKESGWSARSLGSAAAVFLVMIGSAYLYFQPGQTALRSAPALEQKTEQALAQMPASAPIASEAAPAVRPPEPSVRFAAAGTPSTSSVQLAKHETSGQEAKEAEESFRVGLKNYNKAFTQVGKEREALLRSAIVFLQEMEQKYPDEHYWLALSLILIADAHRELGETEKAVGAYQHMVDRFPELEPYCQQARMSVFQLKLAQEKEAQTVEPLLAVFEKEYPETVELASLAFEYAQKIQDANPERAAEWLNKMKKCLSEDHPLVDKADRLLSELDEKIQSRYWIKDWYVLGPLPIASQPLMKGSDYLPINPQKQYKHEGKTVRWKRPHPNQTGMFNIYETIPTPTVQSSAFAATYVYSPEAQTVGFFFPATRIKIWLNGETFWSGGLTRAETGTTGQQVTLKQGWNELVIKTFYIADGLDWNGTFYFSDMQGHVMPSLTIDPTQSEQSIRTTAAAKSK